MIHNTKGQRLERGRHTFVVQGVEGRGMPGKSMFVVQRVEGWDDAGGSLLGARGVRRCATGVMPQCASLGVAKKIQCGGTKWALTKYHAWPWLQWENGEQLRVAINR